MSSGMDTGGRLNKRVRDTVTERAGEVIGVMIPYRPGLALVAHSDSPPTGHQSRHWASAGLRKGTSDLGCP